MTVECITGSITDAVEDNTLCYDMCMTWSKMETIAAHHCNHNIKAAHIQYTVAL